MSTYLNSNKIDDLCNEIGHDNLPMLLDIFLGELNEYQRLLADNSEDLERHLGEISHALKSSAASFGADDLCLIAKSLDALAKTGRQVSTPENTDLILASIQGTITAYDSFLK